MASKNKVEVRIHGKDYTIMGAESEEYIQRVALYIDKKMNEVAGTSNKLSTSMAAVLTAINVADDYFKSVEALEHLRSEIQQYIKELGQSTSECEKYKKETEKLKETVQQLKIELVRKETELNDFITTFDHAARENTVRIDNTRRFRAK
ncbi:cell division protein ZapA [Petroclostridium sp. X23]|uniref:cell division protein ZapA n=1 Tax=Petroclostridium sp. X23 TaxID=3045146 RepID=UPI0024AE40C4|nr:cell division protein ZapA [Petroclostridium sp. X23]WHH61063.1 cell division protein ZapA [Petroclostridium sp. X23]